jgi:hypothetical protein
VPCVEFVKYPTALAATICPPHFAVPHNSQPYKALKNIHSKQSRTTRTQYHFAFHHKIKICKSKISYQNYILPFGVK